MSQRGIRAEVAVSSPENCPVASVSASADSDAGEVAWSKPQDEAVVEEFTVADADADATAGGAVSESVDRLFESSGATRYRFERAPDACVCETIESLGSPVSDVRAEDGTLVVTLHVADVDEIREIIARLRTEYEDVSLRLLRQTADSDQEDLVFVDRAALTDRQQEVLETAASMGYFEYPKGANASEVADALDISLSTFAEHLAAAQTKLLDDVLEG